MERKIAKLMRKRTSTDNDHLLPGVTERLYAVTPPFMGAPYVGVVSNKNLGTSWAFPVDDPDHAEPDPMELAIRVSAYRDAYNAYPLPEVEGGPEIALRGHGYEYEIEEGA